MQCLPMLAPEEDCAFESKYAQHRTLESREVGDLSTVCQGWQLSESSGASGGLKSGVKGHDNQRLVLSAG
jgi:hypothetical protein